MEVGAFTLSLSLLTVGLLATALVLSSVGSASAVTNGKISYFIGDSGIGFNFYTVNSDGSDNKEIEIGDDSTDGPVWAPNGKAFAFSCGKGFCTERSDGSGKRTVVKNCKCEYLFAWSQDSKKIAYERTVGTRKTSYASKIYTVNANGTGEKHLVTIKKHTVDDLVWSPDGKKIAAADTGGGISVISSSGSLHSLVSSSDLFITSLEWSPNGKYLLLNGSIGLNEGSQDHTLVIKSQGHGRLKDLKVFDKLGAEPNYSPNGKQIAFTDGSVDESGQLLVMDTQGKIKTKLGIEARRPVWSPDGKQLVLIQNVTSDPYDRISTINANGSDGAKTVVELGGGEEAYIHYLTWLPKS